MPSGASLTGRLLRADLPTPALIVDLPALERNIAKLAEWALAHKAAIRPHAKTHKCSEIARRQIAAGAVGICCAKLGEAEALAAQGIDDILITSPITARQSLARLAELRRRVGRLAIVVDHPEQVTRLAGAFPGQTLDVLVDIDTGTHRTGVVCAQAAVALARWITECPALRYSGVQFYCGTLQHVALLAERRAAVVERTGYLASILQQLAIAGLPAATVTGGGTGTFAMDVELGVLNELQPGSYVFMDREYLDCDRSGPRFEQSLALDTRVVSANTRGCVTVDAGIKAMATEAGLPLVIAGADVASEYRFMGDEHGMLITPAEAADPPLDALITLLPPHCDPTVNLYDRYAICDGDDVLGHWPIEARGRSG